MDNKANVLKETMPAEPILNTSRKTITYHGALYHFPEYSDQQINAMFAGMVEINNACRYAPLLKLLKRIEPFKIGRGRNRRPGKHIEKKFFKVEKK